MWNLNWHMINQRLTWTWQMLHLPSIYTIPSSMRFHQLLVVVSRVENRDGEALFPDELPGKVQKLEHMAVSREWQQDDVQLTGSSCLLSLNNQVPPGHVLGAKNKCWYYSLVVLSGNLLRATTMKGKLEAHAINWSSFNISKPLRFITGANSRYHILHSFIIIF